MVAAAIHVFAAQIDDILGLAIPKSSGPGYLFRRAFDLVVRLPETNAATFAISAGAMLILYFGKEFFSPMVDRLLPVKVPIPYELIVTVIATAVCFFFDLDSTYSVPIVGEIPTGLAPPSVPRMDIFFDCLANSIGIAIVTIAIHISMAKMLARKKNYEIDESQ
uniref:Sulfate_transp domain-containing protein n=1 Tax=Steinernema glaseri TaxID=37863 RepID=A0A1I8AH86_9BILA